MQSDLLTPDIERDPQPGDSLILFLPVFLSVGIGLYFALPFEPPAPVLWGALVISILGMTSTYNNWRDTYTWRWTAAFFIAASLGLVLAQIRTHVVDTTLLTERVWSAQVTGVVQSVEHANSGWRIVLGDAHIEGDPKIYTLRLSVRQHDYVPQLGQRMNVKATLMPPSPPFVPGAFDFEQNAYFNGISGYGYAFNIQDNAQQAVPQSTLENYRTWLSTKVYSYLEGPVAGVTTALLNGQRGGIDRKTTKELQQSGLQHVISISGVHVSLLAGIVFYVVRLLLALNMRLALTWPIKKIAATFALVAIILYMLIVGLSPPTVRSVIMTGVVLCAILVDREAISLRVVAIAALIILVWQPESTMDIGFQLSFAAVAGLVAFYQYTRDFWLQPYWQNSLLMKALRVAAISGVTTIIATFATAPLILLHFQQIPMLSMVSNALASPVVTFLVMPGTFLSYLFAPVPYVGEFSIRLMGLGVEWMLDISGFVAHLPAAVWRTPALPSLTVALLMLGLFWIVALKSRVRWAGTLFCLAAIVPLFFNPAPDILVTQERVILVPDPDKDVLYAEGKLDSFERGLLLQFTGKREVQPFACEGDICDVMVDGRSVRLVRTIEALKQACNAPKDIILTRYYLDERCDTGLIIDRHDIENRDGALIWVGKDIKTRFGRTTRERRPWQQNDVKQQWHSRKKFVE